MDTKTIDKKYMESIGQKNRSAPDSSERTDLGEQGSAERSSDEKRPASGWTWEHSIEIYEGNGYRLLDGSRVPQLTPYPRLKPGVSFIFGELEKPHSERNNSVIASGLAMLSENVLQDVRKLPDDTSRISLLTAYDPRFGALPDAMREDFLRLVVSSESANPGDLQSSIGPTKKKLPPKKMDLQQYLLKKGRSFSELTRRQQEVASLRYEHGLSQRAIARHLDLNPATVREHLAAFRKKYDMIRK